MNQVLDVAIVGGGISGVYTGWRLLTTGVASSVTLFEASDHIGGRLLSVTPPGIPGMAAELGGMRILPAVQPLITTLIDVLNAGSPHDEQITTYPFPVDEPTNISYLRGTWLRLADFADAKKVPYRLGFQEAGKTGGTLVIDAIEQVVPGITAPGLSEDQRREMAKNASFGGRPLHQQGFWEVLARVMSAEAYRLGLDAGGYQTTLCNWNAADAIPWYLTDFSNADYRGFENGFQQVPLTVAARFTGAGGQIRLDTPVSGFTVDADGVVLTLISGEVVRAKKLVLAMPRRALDLLAPNSPLLQRPDVASLIGSVTPQPLFKLFTTYAYPWWLNAGVEAGRTTTDLPLRQTYYWPNSDGSPATAGPAMLMASYDDGNNIGFWDSFRSKRKRGLGNDAGRVGKKAAFVGAAQKKGETQLADPNWLANAAPDTMVAEAQRQLQVVHGLDYVPEVREAAFRDWGDDPFGGGWNSWNVGVQSAKVRDAITQPVADAPVYICGEAYSDAQGWVEGALQTADLVLARMGVGALKRAV